MSLSSTKELPFTKEDFQKLNKFASVVWGNPNTKAILRKHKQGFEYLELEEFRDAFAALYGGILEHEKILVREEYREALEALRTEKRYGKGAYVTGQPGIGKSIFLIYALIQFLGQRESVAFQMDQKYYGLFTNVFMVYPLEDGNGPLLSNSVKWALCDSGQFVVAPHKTLCIRPTEIRVIQATSPRRSRWHEWSKQLRAQCYIMDIWTDQEIKNLALLLDMDVLRMSTLASRWGNIPRTLLLQFDEKDGAIEEWYRGSARNAVEKGRDVIRGLSGNNLPDEAPSAYFFLRPRSHEGSIDRRLPIVLVATPTILHMLAEALVVLRNSMKLDFYDALSQHADTRQAAGFIYENWFFTFMAAGKPLSCHWLVDESIIARLPATLSALPSSLIPSTSGKMTTAPPFFWVAPNKFPGIDGAIVTNTAIFVFQLTIAQKHKSPYKGLKRLKGMLQEDVGSGSWHILFVGPFNSSVKGIAQSFQEGRARNSDSEISLTVGWALIDPFGTTDDTSLTIFRDAQGVPDDEELMDTD